MKYIDRNGKPVKPLAKIRPSARAGRKKKPQLRVIEGGRSRSRKLVSCEDGFCGTPRVEASVNIAWAKLAAAVELFPDGLEIPGLGRPAACAVECIVDNQGLCHIKRALWELRNG